MAGRGGERPARVLFAIRKQGDLRLLGHVHISNINPVIRSADIGLGIGQPGDRRQGHGREALAMALAYCWRDLNLQRVALTVLAATRTPSGSTNRPASRPRGACAARPTSTASSTTWS